MRLCGTFQSGKTWSFRAEALCDVSFQASLDKKDRKKKKFVYEPNLCREWFSKIIKLADAQSRKSFASLFVHETMMRVGWTSACLNLRFGHLRWTLMPCQMDKIRANVCEERPAAPEQLLDWDINNRLKWRGTGRRGNGPKAIGRQERVQEWNLGLVAGRRRCQGALGLTGRVCQTDLQTAADLLEKSASINAISVRQVRRMPNPPRLPIIRSPSSSFFAPGWSESHRWMEFLRFEWSVF